MKFAGNVPKKTFFPNYIECKRNVERNLHPFQRVNEPFLMQQNLARVCKHTSKPAAHTFIYRTHCWGLKPPHQVLVVANSLKKPSLSAIWHPKEQAGMFVMCDRLFQMRRASDVVLVALLN